MNESRSVSFELDEVRVSAPNGTNGFEIALEGAGIERLSAYVLDFGEGAAVCAESGPERRLGLISAEVLARHMQLRTPDHEIADNQWHEDDRRAVAAALTSVVLAGDDVVPVESADFPGAFVLPEVEPWTIEWRSADDFIFYCPGVEGDEPWGRFHGTVRATDHQATWHIWFMENMLGDAPESGWVAWDRERLLIAGQCDDLDDRGYLCFRLSSHWPGVESPEWDRWRVALARAITLRGDPNGSRSIEFGFRPF